MRLTLPAFAKINLGLEVLGKRPDGYHELVTVFQTISLHDTLVFEEHRGPLTLVCRARGVPGGPDNLVHRAAEAFGRAVGKPQRVKIRLTKRIPAQSGLGGGSSDAAVTLIALNALAGRPLGP
jgi:4-diphosphocytidyl-2-C-methyl-D-erythritol kinase